MPNWCDNTLTVHGSKRDVANFIQKARGRGHTYVGPFNPRYVNGQLEEFDWEGFTPLMMEVLYNNPETFEVGMEQDLSFHSLYPVPKEVLLAPYDSYHLKIESEKYPEWFSRFLNLAAGYDWELKNWGVKWGACESRLTDLMESLTGDDSYAVYSFSTAWSPPEDFFHKICKDFPTLTFRLEYCEPMMDFAGVMVWSDGQFDYQEDRECERDEDDDEDDYEVEPENGQ